MADDDEVDVLGDFSLPLEGSSTLLDNTDLVSQNSDLLNCDYTIHPQWLLDKPSANPDNWYEDSPATTSAIPDIGDTDGMGHIFTENCITDESGWTEKEKNLLQSGLDIFGKSSVRLSQFVGTKTSSEVKYYLKNFFVEPVSHQSTVHSDGINSISLDVLDSNQIPASIEEVIAVVSTGFPTVPPSSPRNKKSRTKSSSSSSSASYSSRKSSHVKPKLLNKSHITPKKRFKIKIGAAEHKSGKCKKVPQSAGKKVAKTKIKTISDDNRAEFSREIITGKGLAVPICEGEEIVTIKNVEDDSSDVSIDVEDLDDSNKNIKPNLSSTEDNSKQIIQQETLSKIKTDDLVIKPQTEGEQSNEPINEELSKQLNSLDKPTSEVIIDCKTISDLEKYIHSEFFDGRSTKTPERYLKIRNYILTCWHSSKPNYIYKTPLRLGLKQCGDVTCISRIHYFLEQIGAINFGCEQTKYQRPLKLMLQFPDPSKSKQKQHKQLTSREHTELGPRQRCKKKFTNDGEGGCTMVHGEKGEIIDTTIINEEPAKPRLYIKKPTIRLIYCRPFTVEKPQEYWVKISLSTLILMDFHSHSYLTEVMGLVGGYWDCKEKTLTICCYESCKNLASSSTHCDMCPISQAKAAENIHNKNLEILGWFHSHPTFAPEPSQQDLDTQQFVQQWIGYDKPCVGVILSPFSGNSALISSPFRCWMVDKKPNFEDQLVPYRFKVNVVVDDFNLQQFLGEMKRIFFTEDESLQRIPFYKSYFQDSSITHLDKFISSVNMHLAKTGVLNTSRCDEIIQGIRDVLTGKS